jgi:hypothetical protein
VFAVRGCGDDLVGVELVRRAQDHCVDGVVGQHRVQVGPNVADPGHHHVARTLVDVDTRDDLNVFACVKVAHDLAAPPSQSHDGCFDHAISQLPASRQRIVGRREVRPCVPQSVSVCRRLPTFN